MLIQKSNLYQLINEEVITEITRADDTKVTAAISQAISEAKAYLSRYDLAALFGTNTDEPTVDDDFLKDIIINLACWKLVKLCNANLLFDSFKGFYESTTELLEKIQKGKMTPQGWPYNVPATDATYPGAAISATSTTKKNNYI